MTNNNLNDPQNNSFRLLEARAVAKTLNIDLEDIFSKREEELQKRFLNSK